MNLNRISFVIGIVGAAVISAVTVPLLAWFYTPEAVGKFAFFLLTTNFVIQLGTLGLEQAYVREYHATDDKAELLRKVLFLPSLLIVLSWLVSIGLGLFDDLSSLIVGVSSKTLGLVFFMSFAAAILTRFLIVFLRVWGRGWLFTVVLVVTKIVFLVLAFVGAKFFDNVDIVIYTAYLVSVTVPALIVASVILWRAHGRLEERKYVNTMKYHTVRSLLLYSLPLMLGATAFWGVKFSGQMALRYAQDFSALALYSVAVSIAMGAAIFGTVFNTLWAPFLFKNEKIGATTITLSFGVFLTSAFLLAGVGGIGLAANHIVKVLPITYSGINAILPLLIMGPFLYTLSETTGSGIALKRKTRFALFSGLIATIIALVLAFSLVPIGAERGAALACFAGYLMFFVFRTEWGSMMYSETVRVPAYVAVLITSVYAIAFMIYQNDAKWIFQVISGCMLVLSWPYFHKAISFYKQLRRVVNDKDNVSNATNHV